MRDHAIAALEVDPARLFDRLDALAEIGALTGGGCSRLALTDEDRRGRDLVTTWMRDLGMSVSIDTIGNIVGTYNELAELMARVQAAIRRTQKPATNTHVSFGNVTADFSGMEVFKDGVPVLLTAHEIKLLQYFVEHAERVITREELLNDVWNYTSYPTTRTVDNHIMKLRQKLEADPAKPVYFRTIHGIGYKFVRGN